MVATFSLTGCKEEVAEEEVAAEEAVVEEVEEWTKTIGYKKEPPYTIGLSTEFMGESWVEIYVAEMKEEIAMYGDDIAEFVHVDSAADIPTQIANMEDFISMGLDVIIMSPTSPTAVIPVLEKAYDAGIVTIVSCNTVETDKYTTQITVDQIQFGIQSAQWLVDELGGKGTILALRGIPGHPSDFERWSGAASVFEQYPDIEVYTDYGHWSYDKAKEVSKAMIAAYPDFDGIWTMGGQMSNAFVDTLVEAGYDPGDYPHGSEDSNGYCKKALEYGIRTFVSSDPVWQGRLVVRAAMDALRGMQILHTVKIPSLGFGPEEVERLTKKDLSDLVWLSSTLSDEELREMFK